jgi:ADP-heptose:LPS heptosyltransferase
MKLWIGKAAWASKRARALIEGLQPANITSIAVIKHGAFGDVVLTRPFLITLRDYFPHARISLSVASPDIRGIPIDLVDRVHVPPAMREGTNLFWKDLKNYKTLGTHDLLFDLTSSARSRWITFLNRALLKVGFISKSDLGLFCRFFYDVAVPRTEFKFEAETFLDQLNVLGLEHKWPLQFDVPKQERNTDEKYIAYFPAASVPDKCWHADGFIELISRLLSTGWSYNHIVLSGLQDWEKRRAEQIVQAFHGSGRVRIVYPGDKDLEIIGHAELVVSNDTGIRTYAIAAGIPTVGIFFSTTPFRYSPRFGQHKVVFETNGALPAVDKVYRCVVTMLKDHTELLSPTAPTQ